MIGQKRYSTKLQWRYTLSLFGISTFALVMLFASCAKKTESAVVSIHDLKNSKDEVFIREWRILAPLQVDSELVRNKKLAIDADVLKDRGYSEETISPKDLDNMPDSRNRKLTGSDSSVNSLYRSDNNVIFFKSLNVKGETQLAVGYAMTTIRSDVEQDVTFLTGGADMMKIWVNNTLLYRKTDWSPTMRHYKALGVHLKKGDNDVLVKIYNHNGQWSFYLGLGPVALGKEIYLNKQNGNFLVNSLFQKTVSLEYDLDKLFFKQENSLRARVRDASGRLCYDKELNFYAGKGKIPVQLSTGQAYAVQLRIGNDSISQLIYVGDTAQTVDAIKKQVFPKLSSISEKNNLEAYFIRYNFLNEFAKENGYDPYLERKIVYCLYEMDVIAKRSIQKLPLFQGVPGLHMRSYLSKIDGKKQYYMIYIPTNYNSKKPLPLVIEMPWVADVFRHFLKGWRVADLYRINMVIRQAEKFGYGYLWSCSRTYSKSSESPVTGTALFEEIEAVEKDYHCDPNSRYLIGTCLGGGNAILVASQYPTKFAAVGVTGPAIEPSLLQPIENFKTLPLYIEHSEIDGKADFRTSERFATDVRLLGGHAQFINLGSLQSDRLVNFYPQDIILRHIFTFFRNKHRLTNADTIQFTALENKFTHTADWLNIDQIAFGRKASIRGVFEKNNIRIKSSNVEHFYVDLRRHSFTSPLPVRIYVNDILKFNAVATKPLIALGNPEFNKQKNNMTAGPISEAFAGSFILVPGKQLGNSDGQDSCTAAIQRMWNEDFNDSCKVIADRAITSANLKNNNLILIGNTSNNVIIKKVAKNLGLAVGPHGINFKGNKVNGDHSVAVFIHPNPYNSQRYVLVITASDLNDLKDFSLRPWYDGIKDYVIYQGTKKINSGYFNQQWN